MHWREVQLVPERRPVLAVVQDLHHHGLAAADAAAQRLGQPRLGVRPRQEAAIAADHFAAIIAGQLLERMVPQINKTSDLVQEITAASQEQTTGVGQINSAVSQLSQTTQRNAANSQDLATTAEELTAQADLLQGLMAFFRVGLADGAYPTPRSTAAGSPRGQRRPPPRRPGVAGKRPEGGPSFG